MKDRHDYLLAVPAIATPANDDSPPDRGLLLAAASLLQAIKRRRGRLSDVDPAVVEAARALVHDPGFAVDAATRRAASDLLDGLT
jgi:hypothetical protein